MLFRSPAKSHIKMPIAGQVICQFGNHQDAFFIQQNITQFYGAQLNWIMQFFSVKLLSLFFLFIPNTCLMVFLQPPKTVTAFKDNSRKKLVPPMRIKPSWVPPIFFLNYPFSPFFFLGGGRKNYNGKCLLHLPHRQISPTSLPFFTGFRQYGAHKP